MRKFQRNYKLIYTIPGEDGEGPTDITIRYPFTLEFDINRNTFASANEATFRIYNLAESTREKIFQDAFNINRFVFVELYAGYGINLPLIFTGRVMQAYHSKQGTDIITEIQALDNDIVQSYSNKSFQDGTPKKDIVKSLVDDMPNTQLGAIGTLEGSIDHQAIFEDGTFNAISRLTGGNVFVDLGKLNVLNPNEVLGDVGIYKITSATGLLGTPRRRDASLELDMIFAPEIAVGQLVEIDSMTNKEYNGQFKVCGINHKGTISGAVCGEAVTTVSLFVGALLPNANYIFTGVSTQQPLSTVENEDVEPLTNSEANTVRKVRQYLISNIKAPTIKITRSISWNEALCKYPQQREVPSLTVLSNLYSTAKQLQAFVDKFYPNGKVVITSGWRSSIYNRSIGGASKSAHIEGKAFDFVISGVPTNKVYQNLKLVWGGRRYYLGQGFIHADIAYEKGPIARDK